MSGIYYPVEFVLDTLKTATIKAKVKVNRVEERNGQVTVYFDNNSNFYVEVHQEKWEEVVKNQDSISSLYEIKEEEFTLL